MGTSGQPFNITLRNVFVNAINGIALNTGNCVDSNFYSVIVNGYNASSTVVTTDGILVGSTNNNFYGCWVEGCTNGIYAVGTIAHFFGCTLSDAPYTNIKIGANIAQYSFNGCYLENAVVIYSNSSYSYGCVDFVNCFIESSSTSNLIDLTNCASGSQVNFIGGRFSELSGSQNIYIPSGVSVNCINVGQSTPTFSGAGTFTLLSNTSNSTAQAVFPASVSVSGTVAKILSGTGSPQGVVAAPVGSIFLRTDGGTSTTFYVKETGTTTSSGWVAK